MGSLLGGNGIMASNGRNGLKPLSSGVITEQPPEQPQTVPSMASCAMPCVAQQDVETTTNGGEPKRYWQADFLLVQFLEPFGLVATQAFFVANVHPSIFGIY